MASRSRVMEVEEEGIENGRITNVTAGHYRTASTPTIHAENDQPTESRGGVGHTYQNISVSGNVNVHVGNNFYTQEQNFFISGTEKHRVKREKYLAGKRPDEDPERTGAYSPHIEVKNDEIKPKLLDIALSFLFLDRCFANCFQTEAALFGRDHVRQLLDDAREKLASSQNSQDPYLGDLGIFCEEVSQTWTKCGAANPEFTLRYENKKEILYYLQDSLEVPYWELMTRLFTQRRANKKDLFGDVVLHVLGSVKLDLRRRLDELKDLKSGDEENISPILGGIDKRLKVLDDIWDDAMSNPHNKSDYVALLERSRHPPAASTEEALHLDRVETGRQPTETVILIAVITFFVIGAIIPLCKGFAISMQSNSPGTMKDADYFYLLQSSLMAALGNIIMIIPFLWKRWFLPAYSLMWVFFCLSLTLTAISVSIYPYFNAGWSSLAAFLGSILSAAFVLVTTQATLGDENRVSKVKTD